MITSRRSKDSFFHKGDCVNLNLSSGEHVIFSVNRIRKKGNVYTYTLIPRHQISMIDSYVCKDYRHGEIYEILDDIISDDEDKSIWFEQRTAFWFREHDLSLTNKK